MEQALPYTYKLEKIVEKYDDLIIKGSHIFCTACNQRYLFRTRRDCERHLRSISHRQHISEVNTNEEFCFDLCVMLCACNLSWSSVDHDAVRAFFKKYKSDFPLPSSASLRKQYLPRAYENVMQKIREHVKNKFLWVAVDETMDFRGNKVVNVLIRILNVTCATPPILIASKRVLKTTATEIEVLVKNALSNVDAQSDRVIMLATDGAAYMLKAGKCLKQTYHNMIHITCLTHALNLVAEEIRKQFPVVDLLVWSTTNIFAKSGSRKQEFTNLFPNIPLPPQPVHMRWCTWIQAVVYYAEHFQALKTFVLNLHSSVSRATQHSQQTFQQPNIYEDICDIAKHCRLLVAARTKLEDKSVRFSEVLSIISDVEASLTHFSDAKSKAIVKKLQHVLNKNAGYKRMCELRDQIMDGVELPADLMYLQYAPLTSVDVEQSFSLYKLMYRPQRSNLTALNAERILVTAVYAQASLDFPSSPD